MQAKALPRFLTAAALAVCTASTEAQVRRAPGAAAGVPVEVALQVGAKKYTASGQGECKFSEQGSIYDVPASQFFVSHRASSQSSQLTLWSPKDGRPEMVALHISMGGKQYEVDTVKAGAKRDTKGSGQAKMRKSGAGATFTIDAVTQGGEKISGTVKCGGLTPIHAEGG